MKTTTTTTAAQKDDKKSPISTGDKRKKEKKKKKKKQSYKSMLNDILKPKTSYEEKDKQKILNVTAGGKFPKIIKI